MLRLSVLYYLSTLYCLLLMHDICTSCPHLVAHLHLVDVAIQGFRDEDVTKNAAITLPACSPSKHPPGLVQLQQPYFLNNSWTIINHGLQPQFTLISQKNLAQLFFGKILPQFWIFPSLPHSAELWPRQRKTTGRSAKGKLQLRWVKIFSIVLGLIVW